MSAADFQELAAQALERGGTLNMVHQKIAPRDQNIIHQTYIAWWADQLSDRV